MSRRDLVHVLTALAAAADAEVGVGVRVSVIDRAIGRSAGDMRTPLDLEALRADALVTRLADGSWALTEAGVERLREDQ
jgi:hypothetical protein